MQPFGLRLILTIEEYLFLELQVLGSIDHYGIELLEKALCKLALLDVIILNDALKLID